MIPKICVVYSKQSVPLFVGLWLGIAFSLMSAPFFDDNCLPFSDRDVDTQTDAVNSRRDLDPQQGAVRRTNALPDDTSDFEPRILEPPADVNPAYRRARKKVPRPRYASTELRIREKLFVGVITSSSTIETTATALNRTLAHLVPKTVFFSSQPSHTTMPNRAMSVVIFPDEHPSMLPLSMLDYVGRHFGRVYDWFYFVPDSTYVRGRRLLELVEGLSVSQDVHMGGSVTSADGVHCGLNSGILLSNSVLKAVISELDWCTTNIESTNHQEIVESCILHGSVKPCMQQVATKEYLHYSTDVLNFDDDIASLRTDPLFNSALTVHGSLDETTIYKLHRYFCELELNETLAELEQTKAAIVTLDPKVPAENLTWPVGIEPPVKLKNRFDVIRWDYFTETHIYFDTDSSNMRELTGIDKEDIVEIMERALAELKSRYPTSYHYSTARLSDGYRRFDPARGMQYMLDFTLSSPDNVDVALRRRVHLFRPLGPAELVPMPYVTESSRVTLVLTVTPADRDEVIGVLDSYAKTCLDAGDNTHLFVVFITDGDGGTSDPFAVLKSMIAFYEAKYRSGAHIAWTAVSGRGGHRGGGTTYAVTDAISRKFTPDSLFLICTVGMELSTEFLNRVRMNTILGVQVFFPIAFWAYRPNLVYDSRPYPTTIQIDKNEGHFDSNVYEHASFYNSDYMRARQRMVHAGKPTSPGSDLYDLFVTYAREMHVLRSSEPALRLRHRERPNPNWCDSLLGGRPVSTRCHASRDQSLASRARLATLVLQRERRLDAAHLDEIRRQNALPNGAEQMRPNMLK